MGRPGAPSYLSRRTAGQHP